MGMITEELLNHFDGVKKTGTDQWKALNPLGDKKPSLSITADRKNGKTLLHAFNGGTAEEILAAVGLNLSDLFYPGTGSGSRGRSWQEKTEEYLRKKSPGITLRDSYTYSYTESGEYAFTRIRLLKEDGEKDFRYGTLNDDRDYLKIGLNGKKRADLPVAVYGSVKKILEAKETDHRVYYCEGEKDVETLQEYGLLAFTAGSAKDGEAEAERFAPLTAGADLVIFSDNDDPGRKSSAAVFRACQKFAKTAKIIVPMKDEPKADISDFMKIHTKTELDKLIEEADDTREVLDQAELTAAVKQLPEESAEEAGESLLEGLSTDKNGKIHEEIANYCTVMEKDENLRGRIRFNEMANALYVHGDVPWLLEGETNTRPWKNSDDSNLLLYLESRYGLKSEKRTDHAIKIISNKNRFNPLKDLLNSLSWDGVPRIKTLLSDYLGAAEDWYSEQVMKLIMMGAINRAMHPGSKFDSTVILVGDQGKGKSTFVKILAMDDAWFAEAPKSFDSEESMTAVIGKWIIELGELAAIRKTADFEAVKRFLTSPVDHVRLKYEKRHEDFPRTCVFIGTTNKRSFLTDKTGNRRFVPIVVNVHKPKKDVFAEDAIEDIRQAWAEAMTIYRSGDYILYPEKDPKFLEMIDQVRQTAADDDSLQGEIELFLEGKDKTCTKEIFDWLDARGSIRPPVKNPRDLNQYMDVMPGWKKDSKKTRLNKYGVQVCYSRNPLPDDGSDEFTDVKPEDSGVFS